MTCVAVRCSAWLGVAAVVIVVCEIRVETNGNAIGLANGNLALTDGIPNAVSHGKRANVCCEIWAGCKKCAENRRSALYILARILLGNVLRCPSRMGADMNSPAADVDVNAMRLDGLALQQELDANVEPLWRAVCDVEGHNAYELLGACSAFITRDARSNA